MYVNPTLDTKNGLEDSIPQPVPISIAQPAKPSSTLKNAGSGLQGVGRRCVLDVHQGCAPRVSLPRTQRTRFRPLKAGSEAQGAQVRSVLDVRERLWNAAHQVLRLTLAGAVAGIEGVGE